MSLNKTPLLPDSSGPAFNSGEKVHLSQQVKFQYEAGTGYPGTASQQFQEDCTIYLTGIRIILLPKQPNVFFKSVEVPLQQIKEYKSSIKFFGFGAKTWEANINVSQDSGLLAGHMTLTFYNGGAFEFNTYLDQLIKKLSDVPYVEPLPMYSEQCNSNDEAPSITSELPRYSDAR